MLCLLGVTNIHAQVTIGSNYKPNSNALLDLRENADSTSSKGLLLPRMALTSTISSAPMTVYEKGMVVYNTATVNDVTPGFYYSNGTKWVKISSSDSNSWLLTGNTSTTPGSDFLGTTDDQDLVFKRNNVQAGWLSDAKKSTAFGVGSLPTTTIGMRNTAFGYQALGAGTGYNSVAIGEGALLNATGGWNVVVGNGLQTTSGTGNVALGWGVALNATSGINNMIVGNNSMQTLSSGNENVGVGNQSLQNISTGSYNLAIGSQALNKVSTTNNNTGIGYRSGFNVTGANNLTIGANTTDVPTNANSNQMNIGNTIFGTGMTGTISTPAGNIGINTTAPGNTLEVNSGIASSSGLRFTKLNTTSTTTSGTPLGVDANGDVVALTGTMPQFTGGGNLVITSIGATQPTKGTTRPLDYINYRELGNKEVEIYFEYVQTSAGTAGQGASDYLFQLPGGYQFDLTRQIPFTGSVTYGATDYETNSTRYSLLSVKHVVWSDNDGNNRLSFFSQIIPYDATHFRIVGSNSLGAAYGALGTNNYDFCSLNKSKVVIRGNFTFFKP
ncbi:MAG: hypothetical protein QM654_04870 [Dysgonamonadaceae bacterium]